MGRVMIIDLVHGVGHSAVPQILLQMIMRVKIMASPPFCINSAGMLSSPGDFPPFRHFTVASTSSLRMGDLSSLVS